MTGSNRRPPACKADALPAELILHMIIIKPGNVLLLRNVSPTTIGAKELNFCVRHGNRCDLFAIATRQNNLLNIWYTFYQIIATVNFTLF